MAVRRQGIYVEYSMEYSKCRALNVERLFGRRLRGLTRSSAVFASLFTTLLACLLASFVCSLVHTPFVGSFALVRSPHKHSRRSSPLSTGRTIIPVIDRAGEFSRRVE
eukprot:1190285-Prorocentrum_minimum.AAC.2